MTHSDRIPAACVCLLMLATPVLTTGCSVMGAVKNAELKRLEIQRDSLKQLKTELQNPDFAVDKQDALLFVHGATLNAILSAADSTQVLIPGSSTAFLQVNSIRYAGEDGSGLVQLDALASEPRFNIQLQVVIVARIVLQSSQDQTKLVGRLVVDSIAPEVKWNCARWRVIGLARRIIMARANEWALNNVKFEIPLSHAVVIDVPASTKTITVPVPAGAIDGQLNAPAFNYKEVVSIRGIWLLRDGIHVLVKYGARVG